MVKYRTTAWQAFEERERGFWAVKKREAGGGGWVRREGRKERPASRPLFSCYKHPPGTC